MNIISTGKNYLRKLSFFRPLLSGKVESTSFDRGISWPRIFLSSTSSLETLIKTSRFNTRQIWFNQPMHDGSIGDELRKQIRDCDIFFAVYDDCPGSPSISPTTYFPIIHWEFMRAIEFGKPIYAIRVLNESAKKPGTEMLKVVHSSFMSTLFDSGLEGRWSALLSIKHDDQVCAALELERRLAEVIVNDYYMTFDPLLDKWNIHATRATTVWRRFLIAICPICLISLIFGITMMTISADTERWDFGESMAILTLSSSLLMTSAAILSFICISTSRTIGRRPLFQAA